jgi:hypothetical protein
MAPAAIGREGRPDWNLLADDDRYLIAAFWAIQIYENKFRQNTRATRHAVAMTLAAVENGKLEVSPENRATLHNKRGKLSFKTDMTLTKDEKSGKGGWAGKGESSAPWNRVKARCDDIRRKADRALKSEQHSWLEAITAAFTVSFYGPDCEKALLLARVNCTAVGELAFFERSLRPFIIGRFDSAKRVNFRLPEFMPNFS